eukprot:TRINITY_DN2681_c0_g1_i3.p1 TRINITY_DN2681_c0_g1~~TRINITY_DN2681_c0_g1_i3.p1  ORF type:complete len:291 (-),score=96.81 TRINITY_DN2681_c0_g1_i3:62-934(-)
MKVLKKAVIVRNKDTKEIDREINVHAKMERDVLLAVRHPFIVDLKYAFQAGNKVYLIMEYLAGGELFMQLQKERMLMEDTAIFYLCQVLLAIEHLHNIGIIYRDLKPENILLDRDGHIIITDFGFSKRVVEETWSLCGTPEYLAPEILQPKGHNKAEDWWALGILIYEMLAGYPPFTDENPFIIYEKILAGNIAWPQQVDGVAKDLVRKLLEQDSTKRLGNMKMGTEDVKNHKFFHGIDWSCVDTKKMVPPIVPNVRSMHDIRNYILYNGNTVIPAEPVSEEELRIFQDF